MENRLKQIRELKKLTLAIVAEKAGTSPQQIHKLENSQRSLDIDWLKRLSDALEVTPEEILGLKGDGIELEILDPPKYQYKPIPVVSWVQAGGLTGIVEENNFEDYVISTKKTSPGAFALRVQGDSMETRFKEGDIIIVDPEIMPQIGDYCVAVVDDESTFKMFYKETEEHIILKPLNQRMSSILIEKNNGTDFRFVGKVVDLKAKL